MSRETERVIKEMHKYISEKTHGEVPSDEEMDKLIQEFMQLHNAMPKVTLTEKNATTADDFLELASEAKTKKKEIEYLQKALELEPNNIDAAAELLFTKRLKTAQLLVELDALIAKAKSILKEDGTYRDSMGHFWGVLETRPYMRLLQTRMELLKRCGMMKMALQQAQEMLKLNPGDNQGIRFEMMPMYAWLEDELHARKFVGQNKDEKDSAFFQLPLSVLYFSLGQWDKAKAILLEMTDTYTLTAMRKFVRAASTQDDEVLENTSPYGYQPGRFSELQDAYFVGNNLYFFHLPYFEWAEEILSGSCAKRGKK